MIWTLSVLLLLTAPGTSFKKEVTRAYQEKNITFGEYAHILETAVKAPARLPARWSAVLKQYPIRPDQATGILVDTFQARKVRNLKADYPGFPQELAYYIDSDTYPIRVYYNDTDLAQGAQVTLESAEYAWFKEIVQWGFYAPPIVAPEGRFRIYFDDTGMGGGGYCAPVEDYPPTAWDDCVTYLVIDKVNDLGSIPAIVAHELNHATQGAMDCLEPSAFWENTASYMMLAVYPDSMYVQYFLPDFQTYYYWSISDGDYNTAYYYGGFIWPLYLAEVYGSGDYHDAVIIREFWEACMQNSGFSYNSPNYLEAIDNVLKEKGTGTLKEAFNGFSRARYFFGGHYNADYSVIPMSDEYYDYVGVALNTTMDAEQTFVSPQYTAPEPWGVNYIEITNPTGYSRSTTIELVPLEGTYPWVVQVVSLDNDLVEVLESDGEMISFELDPAAFGDTLLVVEHLGGDGFDVNSGVSTGTQYNFSIRPTVPFPLISLVTPEELYTYETYDISVRGTGFQEGISVSLEPADQITVNSVTWVDANQIRVNVTLTGDTLTGPYGVTVTNPDEGSDSMAEAIVVVDNPDPPTSGDPGCSCSFAGTGSNSPAGLFLFMLLFSAAFIRRTFSL
ncbi:hypothetical protein KKF84_10940 [Myxococcota bacterium]|nr:hypothetical protein [Myxococcota bacterium]MBU1535827.1 hypothetical protein [Myxococcota bacterium]